MQAGQTYSATFWAKASKPRRITVAAAVPGTSLRASARWRWARRGASTRWS